MQTFRIKLLVSSLALSTLTFAASSGYAGQTPPAPYSDLYFFGDSVSDSGNVALAIGQPQGVSQVITGNSYIPDAPYYPWGRFSNGPVWAEDFAGKLGRSAVPSLLGGTDFAFGGARTSGPDYPAPTLTSQIGMFLGSTNGAAPAGGLYVLAEVGNDARDALALIAGGADMAQTVHDAATAYANDLSNMIATLRGAGAEHFLVFDNVNLGLVPAVTAMGNDAVNLATLLTASMNQALLGEIAGEAGVSVFDTFSFLTGVVQNPAAYGFTNATDACGAVVGADCSSYVFWDGLHPTAALHELIATEAVAVAVPEPQTNALLAVGLLGLALATRRRQRRD